MDETHCTEILWTETRDLQANDAETRKMLRELRAHIAAIAVDTDGAAFARRDPMPASGSWDRSTTDECAELAQAALKAAPVEAHYCILLWYGQGPAGAAVTNLGASPWSSLPADQITTTGPFCVEEAGATIYAHIIDCDAADEKTPRFISCVSGNGLDAGTPMLRPPPVSRKRQPKSVARMAYALTGTSFLMFLFAAGLALNVGSAARATYEVMHASADCAAGASPVQGATPATPASWIVSAANVYVDGDPRKGRIPLVDRKDCSAKWTIAQLQVLNGQIDRAPVWFWRTVIGILSAGRGQFSITTSMAGMMISIILLATAAGLGVVGRAWGILIDPRNRMSLTRAQLAAWTVILIGGWATLALFNVGFGATELRDAEQVIASTPAVADFASSATSADRTPLSAFPTMDWLLWSVLGISFGTTGLSAALLRPYTQISASSGKTAQAEARTIALTNDSPDEADLSDLVYGETAGNENVVDAPRVQHIAFTAVLCASYAYSLFASSASIAGLQSARAAEWLTPVFASMPPVSDSFVALMVVTHGTLLAGKIFGTRTSAAALAPRPS